MNEDLDEDEVRSITPDVLSVLRVRGFFERLDDQLCPTGPSPQRVICKHGYELTTSTLAEVGFDDEEISDVIRVMSRNGGHCDCEILYNVAEESRLKSRYWNGQVGKSE